MVLAEGSPRPAEHGAVDFKWRPPLRALERPPCECHGPRGRDILLFLGIAPAEKPNPISREGFKTFTKLNPEKPTIINYIMAVAAIPREFERVKRIIPDQQGVTLVSPAGHRVPVKLDPTFLYKNSL